MHDEQEHDPVEDVDGTEGDQEAKIEWPFIGSAAAQGEEESCGSLQLCRFLAITCMLVNTCRDYDLNSQVVTDIVLITSQ